MCLVLYFRLAPFSFLCITFWYVRRVRCGKKEVIADVLGDTGAQVSLVRKGLFSEELLKPSRRPVRLKVANGEIMGRGTHEATMGMEF